MRRAVLIAVLAACCCLAPSALAAAGPPASGAVRDEAAAALHRLFEAEWERGLRESPENAAYQGDHRFDDRWTDMSLEAIARREAADRQALAALGRIDRAALSSADRLDYDTFAWLQERTVARQRFREYLQPVGHQGGVQTADGIAEILPFASARDYRHWIARLQALPVLLEQTAALMRAGMEAGRVPPKVLMQRVPAQIRAQVVDDPQASPFYRPFLKMPDAIPAAEREALRRQGREAIAARVVPAYRDFGRFFERDYLPRTRDSIAATDLPDGDAHYDFLAGWYTTTDLSAEQIHRIGLEEVARIRAQMEKIRAEVGFEGDLHAFFQHLRTDPKFFYADPADLLEAYQALSKRVDPELVKVFRTLPRLPYGVRPIPDNIAPDTTTAYYQPGAVDGSRAGYYYVNLYKPQVRPKWEMLALTLHEAVPGHHFQFARGAELPDLPLFRRTAYFVAYGEGWGLYAERLGYDMGLYEDPYDRMGQLAYDMWRAVRLVVDTGMHAKGWSRQQAIDYFMDNSPKTEQDVVNEIDRYIAWPGQALAYKIGQLRISALREEAARELGPAFDLRDFHDAVLETGSVPLETLETHVRAWIAERKEKAAG
ncbi:DUF885 domain-containing protein [Pseudoxanthomonas broegbernensis]|uniref:DUF885 domain-containing protein n=1 Tax=Pseudoxanthomonas broegbernensis TaxID=83619 RepID=A0A7V8GKE2_9GAMM|nr:DUF885 domain-containing protein [Pseudoxanthomonas broegbernensis]KAF1684984.1 DUF885 domain-containing protein [Pseudoxanthomonas broegbernensis]MBB6064828.1 uncharacterized protein (DUF885 family) [Pseudoxanthomonas broegbernensis]